MMDFLRRLAPLRETDATRAVAVLPSRFAIESPLRATIGQARPAQRPDDDETSLSLDATSPPAATNALAAQRHPVTGVQPSQAAPRPLASATTHRDNGKATSSTHAPAEAPDIDVADPRASQDRHGANSKHAKPAGPERQGLAAALGNIDAADQAAPRPLASATTHRDNGKATSSTHAPAEAPDIDVADPRVFQDRNSERARPISPKLQGLATALAGSHGLQDVAPQPAQPRVALPLSQSILAQRTLQSRDDSQAVHVTIGRIDVVANTAPAPAVRRSPTLRQGTVTLADYLRGGNGSRR